MLFSLPLLSISAFWLMHLTLSATPKQQTGPPTKTASTPKARNSLCPKNPYSRDIKTIGGPELTMACKTGLHVPRNIAKLDCMNALRKFNIVNNNQPNAVYPTSATHEYKSCSLTLKSNRMLNSLEIRNTFSNLDGVGIEAMIDSCCPLGFDWRIDHLMNTSTWVRVIVGAASQQPGKPRSAEASKSRHG